MKSFPPVRIGILGCASVAEYAILAPAKGDNDIQVVAVASRDAAKARGYAGRHGVAKALSYEALIADPEVELVYVALPNSMHAEWTIRALEAGKAVLCEKPLASNADEAQRMVDAARRTGGILIESAHWPYHPLAERMGELLRAGTIGRVREVDMTFHISKDMVSADNFRRAYEHAGGGAMDTGGYCTGFARFATAPGPVRVVSAEATLMAPEIDGAMEAVLEFPGGVIARYHLSHLADIPLVDDAGVIIGDKGRITYRHPFLPPLGGSLEIEADGKSWIEAQSTVPTYDYQARAVARVLREGAAIRTTPEEGVDNMRVVDALYQAAGLRPRGL